MQFNSKIGISNTQRSLESIRSSGLASFHCVASRSLAPAGTRMDCTMNLCLLFSFGS
uniref:Uncharacterized protein n=1 Tax=Cyprinus carpio TaxID=7962 RepID=A0A8C2BC32_CYPCA